METLRLVRHFIHRVLLAYGTLFLAAGPGVGALVLTATLLDPQIGLLGLAAGLAAVGTRASVRLPALAGEAEVLNAIYVGLVLGAFYAGSPRLFVLVLVGGALVVPLAAALGPLLRQTRELPLLGAPFLCTLWTLLPAAKALGIPLRGAPELWLYPAWIEPTLSSALSTLGALFYVANPLSGLLVLAAVLLASPMLAGFAIAGGGLAWGLVTAWGVTTGPLPMLAAFNGALTALILSTHTTASGRSLAVAAGGVGAATLFSVALWWLLWPLGLPPLSAPFLLAVWLVRAALRPEHSAFWSRFWLPIPATPETSASRWRLEQARGVERTSIALRPPFVGHMEVSQAMDDALTHRGPWRYALDFVRTEQGLSFKNEGRTLSDFYCFDLPVLSPVWGTVLAVRNEVADNPPGECNLSDNWGNHVLIGLADGQCVLLAHLRQGSIEVAPGQWLAPGTPIGRCGNSGRSTQPHLHLQCQQGAWLGAPTRAFHLAGYKQRNGPWVLDGRPQAGEVLDHPAVNPGLAQALRLAPGREWRFVVGDGEWGLKVQIGLFGETVLVSERGARLAACHTDLLFAVTQRGGAPDPVGDAFALAFGLTPLIEPECTWRDAPAPEWLGLTGWQRLRRVLRRPLGGNIESRYERRWDARHGRWEQHGWHRLPALGGAIIAETLGLLSETVGPVGFSLTIAGRRTVGAGLTGVGNHGDHGIPAWSVALGPSSHLVTP
ncbi:urea transporter [uncultured Thiodictyon sp.]|uniref:urea transporter n=1 Tax=uncultured Thiodictyon sp. TaxID=1846217 RepID=UPI0025E9C4E5|nr:urea transporter [uncultured Thiodictyon sp.]